LGIPKSLHPIAQSFEIDGVLWKRLANRSMPISPGFPATIQMKIIAAAGRRSISDERWRKTSI
jgi:hypothetical protein